MSRSKAWTMFCFCKNTQFKKCRRLNRRGLNPLTSPLGKPVPPAGVQLGQLFRDRRSCESMSDVVVQQADVVERVYTCTESLGVVHNRMRSNSDRIVSDVRT